MRNLTQSKGEGQKKLCDNWTANALNELRVRSGLGLGGGDTNRGDTCKTWWDGRRKSLVHARNYDHTQRNTKLAFQPTLISHSTNQVILVRKDGCICVQARGGPLPSISSSVLRDNGHVIECNCVG